MSHELGFESTLTDKLATCIAERKSQSSLESLLLREDAHDLFRLRDTTKAYQRRSYGATESCSLD